MAERPAAPPGVRASKTCARRGRHKLAPNRCAQSQVPRTARSGSDGDDGDRPEDAQTPDMGRRVLGLGDARGDRRQKRRAAAPPPGWRAGQPTAGFRPHTDNGSRHRAGTPGLDVVKSRSCDGARLWPGAEHLMRAGQLKRERSGELRMPLASPLFCIGRGRCKSSSHELVRAATGLSPRQPAGGAD